MSASLNKIHKVSKGESLQDIPKKYGHKDWKSIWKAPENRALVSKRSKPENLQPGDSLLIPPNEKQIQDTRKKLLGLQATRDGDLKLRAGLVNELERANNRIKIYDQRIKGEIEGTKEAVEVLEKNLHEMRNWATGVDAAAFLAKMGVTLGKLSSIASKASSATGEALEKLNEEAMKEAIELAKEPLQEGGVKAVSKLKERASKRGAVMGILAESWEKMTSPSFWAQTYVEMTDNGRTWSQAVTMEIGQSIEERIKLVVRNGANAIQKLQAERATVKNQLTETQRLIQEHEARIKRSEQEASQLPRV